MFILILHMRKLRHRWCKQLAQDHTVPQWQSQDSWVSCSKSSIICCYTLLLLKTINKKPISLERLLTKAVDFPTVEKGGYRDRETGRACGSCALAEMGSRAQCRLWVVPVVNLSNVILFLKIFID